MVDETQVTHDNNGRFYRIKMDIAKEGSSVWNLTPYVKGRVGDNRFGLQVKWTYQGRTMDVKGMKPYIAGNVGQYGFDEQKDLRLADDASVVHYVGSPDDCQDAGNVTYYFPEQMFPKDGIFKGHIGLLDDRDGSSQPHISGVTIWFKVLPGIAQMGHACDFYISELEKALQNFKATTEKHDKDYQAKLQKVINDAIAEYSSETQTAKQFMDGIQKELHTTSDALHSTAISAKALQDQINAGNLETTADHKADIAAVKDEIGFRFSQIKHPVQAFDSLAQIQAKFPAGADGDMLAVDTGHIYIYQWDSNQWKDCGQYQAQGLSSADRNSIDNGLKGLGTIVYGTKAPYDDLDTLPSNTILTYPNVENVAHLPDMLQYDAKLQGITITTYNYLAGETTIGGTVQVLHTSTNDRFWRIKWGKSDSPYGPWNKPMFSKFEVFFANTLKPPFNSCDDLPDNTLVIYADGLDQVKNSPKNVDHGAILTFNLRSDSYGKFQLLYLEDNTYMRMWWGSRVAPQGWQLLTYKSDNKDPVIFTSNDNLDIPPQYQDLNTLPLNQVVTYSSKDNLKNYPDGFGPATVMTYGKYRAGAIQILIDNSGKLINRVCWGTHETYTNWQSGIWKIPVAFKDDVPAEYQDLNTLPLNQVVTYANKDNLKNYPDNFGPGTVMTYGSQDTAGQVQFLIDNNGKAGCRIRDNSGNYGNWTLLGGYEPQPSLALFRSIGIIGDSYASGELAIDKYADHYNMSWGQILGRKIGASVVNFSRGGQTTKGWLSDTERGLGLLNNADALDLYIIALGINDYQKLGDPYLGSDTDIDNGADTYYGNYGKVIKAIQTKAPMAKIVIATLSQTDTMAVKYNSAIKNIAKHFNLPYVTLTDDPFFTSDFYLNHMYGGHPTGPVYAEMANAYERLISRAMVNNLSYFENYEDGFETDNASDLKKITSPQLENRIDNLESRLTNLEHGTTQE